MTERRIIHLVDDEESIRRSAGFMLRTSGFTVETYESGDAFLKVAKDAEPGCILLDIRMPGMDGLEVQQALAERGVTMPVVMLTGHGDVGTAVRAMKQGAVDFLEKPFEKQAVLTAIDMAFARLHKTADEDVAEQEAKVRIARLTAREQDVLAGLVRGHPNKTIAYDLGISPRTVEVHRANLMTKLEVRTLSDALRIAFAAGVDSQP
ncbi:response regulator transcription factor [Stakelama pacifica]|uniref:LuxR family two component transcriptional regulator n=1 Tax=Stakelama pacifica TaxID=517720 RepID=A0A4R6FRJ6_9SPHN|nr:response regulator transcription factor [Stakelama pacifica]MAW98138.1 DNA-binding response regulator [Sphingomonas sp.]MAW98259.1 DNA-binding response regulator [Sphingomonas sp.]TDN83790.1 LuxR family two component transcriptional regulator [Stakelama pacifica]GGO94833.1 DNA-binding response regulator [Stakelama pacifica]